MQPALGHDSHAHPLLEYRGKTGSIVTDLGSGHSEDMKVFFALDARYTDKGDGTVPALTGHGHGDPAAQAQGGRAR